MAGHYRPACYQDLLEGRPVYHRVGQEMKEAELGWGSHHDREGREIYHVSWGWKRAALGGGQGDVPVYRYSSAAEQKQATSGDTRLWVDVLTPWVAPETDSKELLVRLDMLVSGCSRSEAEASFARQAAWTDSDVLSLLETLGYRLSARPACFARYADDRLVLQPTPGRQLPETATRPATIAHLEVISAYEAEVAATPDASAAAGPGAGRR